MFRRTNDNLPKDPHYPADLTSLGYRLNLANRIVEIKNPANFFTFYATDNERANEVRKEAMHSCVRTIVLDQLAAQGVKPIYVNGDGYVEAKPEGSHTAILATDPSFLRVKRDVVVVVNEHMQDLGIWSYRSLMREGGIGEGSAVGLVKKLRAWGPSPETGGIDGRASEIAPGMMMNGTIADENGPQELMSPGIIILNPGQLIYSHGLNTAMAQPTWMARAKANALEDHIRIDPFHNRVPGHETPEAHVHSTFEHVISRLTHPNARLYIVALSEGSEALVKYLGRTLSADPSASIGGKLEAIAFMQPTHSIAQVKPEGMRTFLASRGRSWILDGAPRATLLSTPKLPHNGYMDMGYSTDALSASSTPNVTTSNGHRHSLSTASNSSSSGQAQLMSQSTRSVSASTAGGYHSMFDTIHSASSDPTLEIPEGYSSDEEEDPYADAEVSCPTFSSGELEAAVPELLWPAVMDDVLAWFKGYAEEGFARARR